MTEAEVVAEELSKVEIFQYFKYIHLPPHLQVVSRSFAKLAETIIITLPACAQRDLALVLLLQAKDAAVRAKLFKDAAA